MNRFKAVTGAPLVLVALLAGCSGHGTKPPLARVIASSPTSQQTRDNMREWLRSGGSARMTAIAGDLLSTADGKWAKDPFLTKIVADALTRDVASAQNYRPVPDQTASNMWVNYLTDLKVAAFTLEGVGGGYMKAGDPAKIQKSRVMLVVVDREQKQFQARLAQINAAPGTH